MNRLKLWVMGAALICSSTVFTGCSKSDDGGVVPTPPPQPEDNGANSGSDEIGYIECSWNGTEVVKTPKVANCRFLNEVIVGKNDTLDVAGYYYVIGSHTLEGRLRVRSGNTLNIVLCDGAELKVKFIAVDGLGSTLRIYGQEKGSGKLTITEPGEYAPAIGPWKESGGSIEIHGGDITAKGGYGAAAIGPGFRNLDSTPSEFNTITIYGGTINATGSDASAAIGNNYGSSGGTINIYGGDITASGGDYFMAKYCYGGAGIGGGNHHAAASVNIYGGNIKAYGGTDAAGIGAGENAPNGEGSINIYGGKVIAQGAKYGAGIGGGDGVQPGPITISGGEVYAYAGTNAAGIGGGEGGQSGNITITGGTVRAYGDRWASGSGNSGYGSGIGSGQAASVNTIIIKGGDIAAYGGEDGAGIGTGEEYGSDINSGTIEIHGGKVWAEGKGYGAGIGAGEDATFGVLGISGGRVDAHAGSDCGPWSGGIGAYHKGHGADDNCHIGWAGWQRIYIGKGMRLWTYSPNVGYVENVTNNQRWWNYVHQRPQVAFGECDHPGYTEATCPFCYRETLQLQ